MLTRARILFCIAVALFAVVAVLACVPTYDFNAGDDSGVEGGTPPAEDGAVTDGGKNDSAARDSAPVPPVPDSAHDTTGDEVLTSDTGVDSTDAGDGSPPSPTTYAQFALRGERSCVLRAGQAYCWGDNSDGELGPITDGGVVAATLLNLPSISAPIDEIAIGEDHICALAGGNVWCWGSDEDNQLGGTDAAGGPQPVPIMGLPAGAIVHIRAGDNYTCALASLDADADGVGDNVYCWGTNDSFELGRNDNRPYTQAWVVNGVPNAVEIAAGPTSACAMDAQGGVICWGRSDSGQAGAPNIGCPAGGECVFPPTAVTIPNGDSAQHIAVGSGFACVASERNYVYCWGDNTYGVLGPSVTTCPLYDAGACSPAPVSVTNAVDGGFWSPTTISAGANFVCESGDDLTSCWGYVGDGQAGDGQDYVPVPGAPVLQISNNQPMAFDDVVAGGAHVCARVGSSYYGWGADDELSNMGGGADTDYPTLFSF